MGSPTGGWAQAGNDDGMGLLGERMARGGGALLFGRRTYEDLLSYCNAQSPDRIVFTWKDVEDRGTMEVEVSFSSNARGTQVTVEHRGFERLGPAVPTWPPYAGGWPRVLQWYAQRAQAR